jgi:short subunit dehydrogenase-like uncharacterized protein
VSERAYDLVLFGATGFTGGLTACEIAKRGPAGMRWALAGRNRAKLEKVRARVAEAVPGAPEPALLEADVGDAASIRAVAEAATAVITTVGPYVTYGEPLVAACAAAGTHYTDLTGEPEFVDRMYLAHHAKAVETGARIVHACGFDSIPHDLGAQFTVEQLPEGVPIAVRGYVRAGGRPSGGTFASALTGFSRARQNVQAHRDRKQAEPRPVGRRVKLDAGKPHRALGYWALPLPTIDPQVVGRSARALDRYGPDFSYGHYAAVKRLPIAVGGVAGVATLFGLAQIPPARKALMKRLPAGDGPSPEQIAEGWFKVMFVGEGGGRRVQTVVRGGDPGYGDTSKMLAESGLCLAFDDLPDTSGQVTTAQAMGPALRERVQRDALEFEVVEEGPAEA